MKAPFERAPVRHSAKDPGAMSHTLARLCGVTLLGRHGGKLGHENAITDPVQSFMPVTLFVDTTWSDLWCVIVHGGSGVPEGSGVHRRNSFRGGGSGVHIKVLG